MQTKYDEAIRRMASRENVGHGHVFPRADGARMRCGGSLICAECAKDNALATAASSTSMHADLVALIAALEGVISVADRATVEFDAARDKFNMDNPVCQKPSSMEAYYYAEGEMDALVAAQR